MQPRLRNARWSALPIRIFLTLFLCFCIYATGRRAVGAWYFHEGSPAAIRTALKWDPANPEYYDALGNLIRVYAEQANADEVEQLYKRAAQLSPRDALYWADLGSGYDWAGRRDDAQRAFLRASELFPNSPEINWRLANFYVRTGKIPQALQCLHAVLLGEATASKKVFTLATNAGGDREAILQMLPTEAPTYFEYMQFLLERGDSSATDEVWSRILELKLPFDLPNSFPYLDSLIQQRKVQRLAESWRALEVRFPAQLASTDASTNLVTNGDFKRDTQNGGLDWRVVPIEGAVVALGSADAQANGRALQITFDGKHNLDYGHIFQYVLVQPNTRYSFSAFLRVNGITTDSGPRFQICDAYNVGEVFLTTENLVGSSGRAAQRGEFTSKADTHLLLIRVVRPVSSKFDNQIVGSAWIEKVSLQAESKPR